MRLTTIPGKFRQPIAARSGLAISLDSGNQSERNVLCSRFLPPPHWRARSISVSRIYLSARPFTETRGETQIVNFDLLLRNDGQKPLRLAAITRTVFDHSGRLEAQRELNGNGKPSALAGLGDTVIAPGETKDIFQPFDRYDRDTDLSRIHLTLIFLKPETPVPPVALTGDFVAQLDVRPQIFAHPAAYCLPLDGTLLVHDGHDLNSHHRRQDLAARFDRDPNSRRQSQSVCL